MPTLNITRTVPIKRSPRLRQVEGMFDLAPEKVSTFTLKAELPLDAKPWQIGLIVGPSGCGKTTVARELFGASLSRHERLEWPADASVIDAFPRGLAIQDITGLLSSVGFSSPPAWCRPYQCLSNGEQFRVSVARALAEGLAAPAGPIVIDEFTSVVDRTVAQIGSAAIAKAVRARPGLQFVGAACHYDIIDWLQPDWLFDPSSGLFTWRSLQRRPEIALEVLRAGRATWSIFRRHHYLSSNLASAARCFVGLVAGRPAVFLAVLSFPHPRRPGWRGSRLVCLPDFQGIGLGNRFHEFVAALYAATGKPYRATMGHPALISHMRRSPLWRMIRAPSVLTCVMGRGGDSDQVKEAEWRQSSARTGSRRALSLWASPASRTQSGSA